MDEIKIDNNYILNLLLLDSDIFTMTQFYYDRIRNTIISCDMINEKEKWNYIPYYNYERLMIKNKSKIEKFKNM